MCDWGQTVPVDVTVPAHLSHTGQARTKRVLVDACIADLVRALNTGGIETAGCCCGHGRGDGEIVVADGRVLVVKVRRDG